MFTRSGFAGSSAMFEFVENPRRSGFNGDSTECDCAESSCGYWCSRVNDGSAPSLIEIKKRTPTRTGNPRLDRRRVEWWMIDYAALQKMSSRC